MSGMDEPLDEAVLADIYSWVDQIPLSRPKKNFARDFSDGGMVAEVIAHYFPRLVEVHNYPSTTVTKTRIESWKTMNRKVLKRLNFQLSDEVIEDISHCKPFVVERMLLELRQSIDTLLWQQQKQSTQTDVAESDQYQASPRPTRRIQKFPPPAPKPKAKSEPSQNTKEAKKPVKLVSTVGSSVVPRWQYENKDQECMQKNETIAFLQAKVHKMDQLLQLKDLRIDELLQENLQIKKKAKTIKPANRGRVPW